MRSSKTQPRQRSHTRRWRGSRKKQRFDSINISTMKAGAMYFNEFQCRKKRSLLRLVLFICASIFLCLSNFAVASTISFRPHIGVERAMQHGDLQALSKLKDKYPYAKMAALLVQYRMKTLQEYSYVCFTSKKVRAKIPVLPIVCSKFFISAALHRDDLSNMAEMILHGRNYLKGYERRMGYPQADFRFYSYPGVRNLLQIHPPEVIFNNKSTVTLDWTEDCRGRPLKSSSVSIDINGVMSCFYIDTGSRNSSITSLLARWLQLKMVTGVGDTSVLPSHALGIAIAKQISLGGVVVKNHVFRVFSGSDGVRGMNILGIDFLSHFGYVEFNQKGILIARHGAPPCNNAMRFSFYKFLGVGPVFPITVNGHIVNALFDSGQTFHLALTSSDLLKKKSELVPQLPIINGIEGEHKNVYSTNAAIGLGNLVTLVRAEYAPGLKNDMPIRAVFGFPFLSDMNVVLDFRDHKACLVKDVNSKAEITFLH